MVCLTVRTARMKQNAQSTWRAVLINATTKAAAFPVASFVMGKVTALMAVMRQSVVCGHTNVLPGFSFACI